MEMLVHYRYYLLLLSEYVCKMHIKHEEISYVKGAVSLCKVFAKQA